MTFVFDTIPEIAPDTLSLYLKRATIDSQPDSFRVGFSRIDYLTTDSTNLFFKTDTTAATVSQELLTQEFLGTPLPYSQTIQSIFFLLFVLCFAVLAFWLNREGMTLAANFKNIFSGGVRTRSAFKQQITTSGIWSEVFLILQTSLIISMVAFTYSWKYGLAEYPLQSVALIFGSIFLAVLLLILLKYVIYRLIHYVFNDFGMDEWSGRYITVVELSGLIIFIPSLFFVFVPEYAEVSLFVLAALAIIIVLVVFWNLFQIFHKNKIGLLYYFLYLCAVEILPFLLLYKGAISLINISGN